MINDNYFRRALPQQKRYSKKVIASNKMLPKIRQAIAWREALAGWQNRSCWQQYETGTTRPAPRDRRRSLVPEGPEPDPGRIQRGQRIPSPARHQAAGTVRRRRRTAAWGQEPAHLRRGGPRGGNPGLGSIRPDLRKASEGGVAPLGGVHGATWAAGSGSPDAPATAVRQRCHPGPAAQTRQGHRPQPAERTTESEPGSPQPGPALRRLGPPSAGLPGNRPGGPLRKQHGGGRSPTAWCPPTSAPGGPRRCLYWLGSSPWW